MSSADGGAAVAHVDPSPPSSVWRVAKAGFAAFDGEGARLHGGRWNRPGVRVVYTSGSLSLAALEYFVHVDTDLAPEDLVAVRAEIPPGVAVTRSEAEDLPRDWRSFPAPEALQDVGMEWLRQAESLVLSVPSAVVPEERHYLLDPAHDDFGHVSVGPPRPFTLDPRLWKE